MTSAAEQSLTVLLDRVKALHMATPSLAEFGDWPTDFRFDEHPARPIPATDLVSAFDEDGLPIIDAIRAACPYASWQRTYTEDEVGADFRARYGYFELFGPTGHFHSDQLRCYVGYWGGGLYYDWHNHEAEELYFCVGGSGEFKAEGEADCAIHPGQSKFHHSMQLHAMTTHEKPFLCLAYWRGQGMAGLPRMAT